MMNSYLSIFDPHTKMFLNFNLIAISLPILFLKKNFFLTQNKNFEIINKIKLLMKKEFKIQLLNSPINIFITSTFILIFCMNIFGLLPYLFTMTSQISITMFLAIPMWLSVFIFFWSKKTKLTFTHLVPMGTPIYLTPIMVLIETISNLIRPITLSVRLCANMIAGHLLITLMSSSINFNSMALITSIPFIQISLMILELFVAFIQAYVFTLLLSLYFSEI